MWGRGGSASDEGEFMSDDERSVSERDREVETGISLWRRYMITWSERERKEKREV